MTYRDLQNEEKTMKKINLRMMNIMIQIPEMVSMSFLKSLETRA